MNAPYNVKSRVLGAFRHLLVPLVRVLLRNGVGFHEFAQVGVEVLIADMPTYNGRDRGLPAARLA